MLLALGERLAFFCVYWDALVVSFLEALWDTLASASLKLLLLVDVVRYGSAWYVGAYIICSCYFRGGRMHAMFGLRAPRTTRQRDSSSACGVSLSTRGVAHHFDGVCGRGSSATGTH